MDRDKARQDALSISDDDARMREIGRIEGDYHLGMAVSHMYLAKKGVLPQKEVLWRVRDAIQTLVYDGTMNPTAEQQMRLTSARQTLDADLG
jgi:hypothetical protein